MYGIRCILFCLLAVVSNAEDELIAVSALVRHGARIPLSFYPTDPYQNYPWPYVLGDLTNKGIKEMFHVGQWLRNNFRDFLKEKYDPNEIYVHAVEFDRCLMTAESTLAGLYPAVGDEVWNRHIRWQPVPIHSSPSVQDILTNMLAPCPGKFGAAANVMRNSPEFPAIQNATAPLFEYISKHAGKNISFTSIYPFFDTVFSEKELGLPLPTWVQKIYPDLFPLIVLYTKMSSITSLERRMQAGPLITRILHQFENAISGHNFGNTDTIYRKFMGYFATEWMLYDFTYGLGLESIEVPRYGALYLIELRKRDGDYFVDILYRNDSKPETPAMPWHFKGEKYNLKFETFKKIAEPMHMDTTDWVHLCEKFVDRKSPVVTGVPMT